MTPASEPSHQGHTQHNAHSQCAEDLTLKLTCPMQQGITLPTLIIHAKDDPFMTEEVIPKFVLPDNIDYRLYEHGGHVGFVGSGGALRVAYWLERELRQFIDQFLP